MIHSVAFDNAAMSSQEEEELYLMNELKRIESERKERERVISQDVQKFVQQQEQANNSIQRTVSSSSRRSSINQDYLHRLNSSSNRNSTTQKIVSSSTALSLSNRGHIRADNIRAACQYQISRVQAARRLLTKPTGNVHHRNTRV